MASSNFNDGFADGFNMNDSVQSFNGNNGNYSYDGFNGNCTHHTVTYASNSYDENKRNYSTAIVDDTEHTYWWDRLNAQQTKFGASSVTRPSVGVGTKLTATQANTLVSAFSGLKSTTYSKDISWTDLNAIGTISAGTAVAGTNYKERIRSTLTSLENQCRYCAHTVSTN